MEDFKMYAEYRDGFCFATIDADEDVCMYNIIKQTEEHGECVWYSAADEYDKKRNCYWVHGERFSDFDLETQTYVK